MEDRTCHLEQLESGQWGIICEINLAEDMKQRLQDIGFRQGTRIECAFRSPFRDPIAYFIKGTTIALREIDARQITIQVEEISEENQIRKKQITKNRMKRKREIVDKQKAVYGKGNRDGIE